MFSITTSHVKYVFINLYCLGCCCCAWYFVCVEVTIQVGIKGWCHFMYRIKKELKPALVPFFLLLFQGGKGLPLFDS